MQSACVNHSRPARVCRQVLVQHVNVLVQRNCYRSGFSAARQCFCWKEVVLAHVRVARPLSTKLCANKINISKKNEKINRIP